MNYLDWMRAVAACGLEVVAITDHNTVAGIGAIRREIEWLTKLEAAKRLTDEERSRLTEWRELSNQVLVLPGFEFTATFGFHILGIFPPETSVRHLEHVLLSLNIPSDKLDEGSTETGASTDVLSAYKVIHEAGGMVVAAHANSTHGVAMRNFPFGGQTKIAYTQDPNLDALEVTDLDKGMRSTARFFNGSKTEYPRRMHCIQGSDAHRIQADPKNPKRLGIGDRATDLLLEDSSFEAILALFRSKQFDRTRPARPKDQPFDNVAAARAEGPSIVQSFHESASQRGGRLTAILGDICAFANTMGGTVYVGANHRKSTPTGLAKPGDVEQQIRTTLDERLTPPLELKYDVVQSQGVKMLRIQVPKGSDRPYCLDDYKYYVRDETESTLAVRDELVALIRDMPEGQNAKAGKNSDGAEKSSQRPRGQRSPERVRNAEIAQTNGRDAGVPGATPVTQPDGAGNDDTFYLPQIGVEIVDTQERNGNVYYGIRDLRNGHIIKNVTRKGARKLWNYAIQQHEDTPVDPAKVEWEGVLGMVSSEKRAGKIRYDLALRENNDLRVFYGVTEDGMEGRWAVFLKDE